MPTALGVRPRHLVPKLPSPLPEVRARIRGPSRGRPWTRLAHSGARKDHRGGARQTQDTNDGGDTTSNNAARSSTNLLDLKTSSNGSTNSTKSIRYHPVGEGSEDGGTSAGHWRFKPEVAPAPEASQVVQRAESTRGRRRRVSDYIGDKMPDFRSVVRPGLLTSIPESGDTKEDVGEKAVSLLEELFPAETKRHTAMPRPTRDVPKVAFETAMPEDEEEHTVRPANTRTERRHQTFVNRNHALLVLRKASRYLTEDDFRRVMPVGKHIDGWTSNGEVLRVIRGRDEQTLERHGDYFILFENPSSAQAYLDHVMLLHRSSAAHFPSSLFSRLPPPPNMNAESAGNPNQLYSYTLVPPTQNLHLRLVQQPFSPMMRRIIEQSGYESLMRDSNSKHEVMLWVDGMRLFDSALRAALAKDGKDRGVPWNMVGPNGGIRQVQLGSVGERSEDGEGDSRKAEKKARVESAPGSNKLVLSFWDEPEAKRFVASWHRRDILSLLDGSKNWFANTAMANAELTW